MFGRRHRRRRIRTCSRNSTKPFLVLTTRAKVWNESTSLLRDVTCQLFLNETKWFTNFLPTGRSDRVTRSIKSLVFKNRQSWKILVKLRVFIQRIVKPPLIILSLLFHGVFPFPQVTGFIRASLLRQVFLFLFFFIDYTLIRTHTFSHPLSSVAGFFFSHGDCLRVWWKWKERKLEFILFPDIYPLYFALLFFSVWIISDYYYFRILIGCTHAKMFLFFFLFYLWLFAHLEISSHSGLNGKTKTLTHIS